MPIGRLWGVGPVTEAALAAIGVRTIGDVAVAAHRALAGAVGERAAAALTALARGEDARVVEPDRDARSYGEEGTFDADTTDDRRIRGAILAHAEAVARRLRRDRVNARTVVLKMTLAQRLGGGRFPRVTRQASLPAPTDDGHALAAAALALWERHRPARALRLVGVTATGIVAGGGQLALFADAATRRRLALNHALDRIVDRFGRGSVVRGGAHADKASPTGRLKRGE